MQYDRLPPLKSLVYFEAAARLQSFTAASTELNVTQGAVSRQIRQLEDFLGLSLFRRDRRRVLLTDDGHNYFVSIVDVLNQLARATVDLTSNSRPEQITLLTSSAIASMYLLPRIPEFRRTQPEIQIRIIARDEPNGNEDIGYDISLYYHRRPPESNFVELLFEEVVYPVCSPAYFANHQDQFSGAKNLAQNLIWLESPENWINWPEWLERMGMPKSEAEQRLVVNHYPMVIQAAIAGQGVALGWSGLVDQALEQSLLIRPTSYELKSSAGFYLDHGGNVAGRARHPKIEIFRRWLLDNR